MHVLFDLTLLYKIFKFSKSQPLPTPPILLHIWVSILFSEISWQRMQMIVGFLSLVFKQTHFSLEFSRRPQLQQCFGMRLDQLPSRIALVDSPAIPLILWLVVLRRRSCRRSVTRILHNVNSIHPDFSGFRFSQDSWKSAQ